MCIITKKDAFEYCIYEEFLIYLHIEIVSNILTAPKEKECSLQQFYVRLFTVTASKVILRNITKLFI